MRRFDHIDLRVRNLAAAKAFYGRVLPAIGFTEHHSEAPWEIFYAVENGKRLDFFGITEDAQHRPNETRIAFWAATRSDVDRIAGVVKDAGGINIEGPQIWSEYSPGYYALFFEDPDGNKLEVCFRESAAVAE